MKTLEITLTQIGNSRGIRLPAELIRSHGLARGLVLEDRGHEIALKPKHGSRKFSWEDTAREMVAAHDDWSAWDAVLPDGLEDAPWDYPMPPEMKKRAKGRASLESAEARPRAGTRRRKK
ncbi:MAG: AbrB/MazE/SpoVT family DNA-binding domain-containing protein [Chthoniobacterales bacterium]|jgi:antitoxin component of MazEF toxin-antitoxin module|nr:AbrB/MazE/SpoVT family DNA-binding domain-containing protein [Chthoniobacterales bacterium]